MDTQAETKLKKQTFLLDEKSIMILECMKTHKGMTYRHAVQSALLRAYEDCLYEEGLWDRRDGAKRRPGIPQS